MFITEDTEHLNCPLRHVTLIIFGDGEYDQNGRFQDGRYEEMQNIGTSATSILIIR